MQTESHLVILTMATWLGSALASPAETPRDAQSPRVVIASATASDGGSPTAAEPELHAVKLGAAKPAHAWGSIYLAGQPAQRDLPALRKLGIRTVINLRKPGEINWDERAAVEELGMRYVAVPFGSPGELTDGLIDEALDVLRDQSQGPVLLHCATSNRVGAIWYAHRILHNGLSPEAALEEAKTVGLRTMAYLEPIDAYLDRLEGE